MTMTLQPPAPDELATPESRCYAQALAEATEVKALTHWTPAGVETYAWLFLPSRNTWPTKHINRPAPTPGCGCAPCRRPRHCGVWVEPVEVFTGETVAWICPTCLDQLALGWSCTDCEWAEERRLCDPVPTKHLVRPCQEHA